MPKTVSDQKRLESLHWIGLELARQRATWEFVMEKRRELGDTIGVRHALSVLDSIHSQIYDNSTEQNALRDRGVEVSWLLNQD